MRPVILTLGIAIPVSLTYSVSWRIVQSIDVEHALVFSGASFVGVLIAVFVINAVPSYAYKLFVGSAGMSFIVFNLNLATHYHIWWALVAELIIFTLASMLSAALRERRRRERQR